MDWNKDGKIDLIAGDTDGQVTLFLNVGTASAPKLAEGVHVEAGGKAIVGEKKTYKEVGDEYEVDEVIPGSHELADIYSKIHMADWNGDGLADLLIGHSGTLVYYENSGTASQPRFKDPVKIVPPGGRFPSRPSPYVVDWDGDGVQDLLLGTERSEVYFLRNEGTNKKPVLAKREQLVLYPEAYHEAYRCRLGVTDWNGDGKLDLLVGTFWSDEGPESGGNVWLFLRK